MAKKLTEPSINPPIAFPSPSKLSILRLIRIKGEITLADLATSMGVSKMAILKHLSSLEGEGLVERASIHGGKTGRPQNIYKLSQRANELFPKAYTDVALCALAFIEQKQGRAAVGQMLRLRQKELFDRYNKTIQELPLLKDKVSKLAELRDSEGYMAEAKRAGKGELSSSFEILEHNCPILALASKYGEACSAERDLFTWLLKADVEVSHRVVAGDQMCRFLVRKPKTD